MTSFRELIQCLCDDAVEAVIVGGVAGTVHGSARMTQDLDVLYRRTPENLERLVAALAGHAPCLRGAAPGLPFRFDVGTLERGLNFTLTTDLGDLDLLGEIAGGDYESLNPGAITIEVFARKVRCLSLKQLIHVKRAAGRPKDLEALAELESILDAREDAT